MDLLERQPQLEKLSRHLREAATNAGSIVFLSGEAGAGKTVLIERFAQRAARSSRVVWGLCDALQISRVLGPINEIAAGLAVLQGAPHESNLSREQLFSCLFERLAPPSPASLVVLEDLHWADEATLDFVGFLGRRIHRTRCLLIATYRDDEIGPTHLLRGVLGELTGRQATRVQVPALSLSAVEQLARGTRRDARQIHRVTGGNAFFVRELLAAPLNAVPETVRDAVLARLLHCSPGAQEVAEFVALLPGKAEPWLTRAILGDVGVAADEAVMRGLLRYHDEALAFRHELGRLAVESTVPGARAQALHRRILSSFIEHDVDVSQLVHHASRAHEVQAILEYAPRAAEQASRAGAHRVAAAHLATALRHADSLGLPERARLYELHAKECNVTNQVSAALGSAMQAHALWQEIGDVAAQARVLVLIGRQHWKSGQTALADRHVSDAIVLLESRPPGRELALAYSARSHLAMLSRHATEALEFGQRALDLAARFADYGVQSHALNNIGSALASSGASDGLEQLQRSLAVALEHDLQEHAGRAYANLVATLVRQRASALAQRYVDDGTAYCEVHDVQDCFGYIRAYSAWFDLNRGHWREAARVATEVLERCEAVAISERLPALVVLAVARARRGDPEVDPLLDEAMRLALPTGELKRIGPVAAARAEAAWYRGDLRRVAQEARTGLNAAASHQDRWIQGELVYWGRRADPLLEVPADLPEPYALMIEGNWQRAAACWQQLGAPYEQALALTQGTEEALREGLSILEQLGAGPLAAITRRRLRQLGVRRIPRGPRTSTRENPAGLTSREMEVLALLVAGHTNPQLARRLHVAPKTIEHHVAAILEKLQVRSRTEASAAALALGIAI